MADKSLSESVNVVEKIVLTMDICSSSDIIEDLTLTGNTKAWHDFLKQTRQFIARNSLKYSFILYKFTGDGWILFFHPRTSADKLFRFLTELSLDFSRRFRSHIIPLLESPPKMTGITFGADSGNLIKMDFLRGTEYVGRPINIAYRLQNAIKDKDSYPAYKVLLSKHLFHSLTGERPDYKIVEVGRTLRNIRGGQDYRCIKVALPVNKIHRQSK